MNATPNPLGLRGIAFAEFTSPDPDALHTLFLALGFSRVKLHVGGGVDLYAQGGIRFLLNRREAGHAAAFREAHGPSVPSLGLRVDDPEAALEEAIRRGATAFTGDGTLLVPAIEGIGGSVLYFLPAEGPDPLVTAFTSHPHPITVPSLGFTVVDHLTHNVPKGGLEVWSRF